MTQGSRKKHVVVLGGGFAGLRTAFDLERKLSSEYRVILIDKNSYHTPHAMLYEVASAVVPRNRRIDFRSVRGAVAIPFHLLLRRKNISFVKGEATDIDSVARTVLVEGFRIPYEYLVLALGSTSNYFKVPGLKESSYPLKTLDDALNLRNAIEEMFVRKNVHDQISVVVAGGGFTGVELAAELSSFLAMLCVKYRRDPEMVSLVLLEAGERILPGAHPGLVARAMSRLEICGVPVFFESAVQDFHHDRVLLSKGLSFPADIVAWTAGIALPELFERTGFSREHGFLKTDSFLRIEGDERIYGAGDLVWCFDSERQCPLAPTAQRALQHGHLVAENIFRASNGLPLLNYEIRRSAFVVPLGHKFATADLWGARFSGFLAWVLKMIVEYHYLLSILPLAQATTTWVHGVRVYTRND